MSLVIPGHQIYRSDSRRTLLAEEKEPTCATGPGWGDASQLTLVAEPHPGLVR